MLKAEYKGYQGSIPILKDQHDALSSRCFYLQQMILSHNLTLATYQELEAMGFGLLISELRQYGSIKPTIIHLTQKLERLKYQINTLRMEKQDLEAQNRAVTIALLQLKQIASFFNGSSTSLSNGLLGLISIITYMTYSLNLVTQQRNVQNDKNAPTDKIIWTLMTANLTRN
jgi:hypothetical protein